MKLAAIKKIVMDAKKCIIMTDKEGKQWIGDGKRFYAVDEDFRFERETVLMVLDVDRDKRDKVAVFQEQSSDPRFDIYEHEDDERLRPQMAIMYGGELVLVFMSDKQELFALEHAALKPLGDGRAYTLLQPMESKVMAAIRAEMEIVSTGNTKHYGGEDEEFSEESGKTE